MSQNTTKSAAPAGAATPRKLALAAAVSAVLVGTAWVLAPGADANANAATNPPQAAAPRALSVQQGAVGVADLVERVQPAVVNVSVKGTRAQSTAMQMPQFQFPPGSPFEEFFKRFQNPQGESERSYQGVGSGFIVDPEGWVVTNNHVIDGADEITITLQDGTQLPAELHGSDPKTDLALLKVETDVALPFVTFGDSDAARVGEQVVAIGNPFGLGGSVSTGIISARGRNINSGPYDDYLQVDAPINRGNSGGPLFNLAGEVIGINTAIFSPSGGNVGIGFAIPSGMAQVVLDDLRADGRVERGWLGVQIQPVTGEIAESLGLPEGTRGALVAEVLDGSPAERAGLQTGDVIIGFGDTVIEEVRDLTRAVASTEADSDVAVKVWRQGEPRDVSVAIGRMPADDALADAGSQSSADEDADARLGLALAPLNDQTRSRFRVADDVSSGALVVNVKADGPAAREGLRPGDVIVMVGQAKVNGPADVAKEVKQAAGEARKSVLLLVDREGSQRFVAVPLARA